MPVTTLDQIVAALPTMQIFNGQKIGAATSSISTLHNSSWQMGGTYKVTANPSAGSGDACSQATAGAFPFSAAGAGKALYLHHFLIASSRVQQFSLYDRAVHTSGLSGTSTAAQAVNTVALPSRFGNGDGVELFLEWYTTTGATAPTVVASYTNSAGVAGRATQAISMGATMRNTVLFKLPLQLGDTGVQSVQTVTLSVSTGTAGNFGVTLAKRIASCPVVTVYSVAMPSMFTLGFPKIDNDACLFVVNFSDSTTSPSYEFEVGLIEAVA